MEEDDLTLDDKNTFLIKQNYDKIARCLKIESTIVVDILREKDIINSHQDELIRVRSSGLFKWWLHRVGVYCFKHQTFLIRK